jgi:hypothetical protein
LTFPPRDCGEQNMSKRLVRAPRSLSLDSRRRLRLLTAFEDFLELLGSVEGISSKSASSGSTDLGYDRYESCCLWSLGSKTVGFDGLNDSEVAVLF